MRKIRNRNNYRIPIRSVSKPGPHDVMISGYQQLKNIPS